jgi:hypothetical protein
MTERDVEQPADDRGAPADRVAYEPPTMVVLGTLAQLTQGGDLPSDDGFGGSGDSGSFPPP